VCLFGDSSFVSFADLLDAPPLLMHTAAAEEKEAFEGGWHVSIAEAPWAAGAIRMNTLLPAPLPIVAQWIWTNCELRFPDVGVLETSIAPPPPRNGPLDSASCRGPKPSRNRAMFLGVNIARNVNEKGLSQVHDIMPIIHLLKAVIFLKQIAERPP
jgi:hypothetical protein